jgi:hypothetical protein
MKNKSRVQTFPNLGQFRSKCDHLVRGLNCVVYRSLNRVSSMKDSARPKSDRTVGLHSLVREHAVMPVQRRRRSLFHAERARYCYQHTRDGPMRYLASGVARIARASRDQRVKCHHIAVFLKESVLTTNNAVRCVHPVMPGYRRRRGSFRAH